MKLYIFPMILIGNSSAASMSRSEAIQALSEGKKVTHRYFTDDEFIYQEGSYYVDKDGNKLEPELFWKDRENEGFETGWFLYNH